MALSLTAEQKSIFEIFSGKNQYIIPPYQRPYTWRESHCMELLEDIKRAYNEKKKEGYFLGNIVIAKSIEDRNRLEVIDGQQRLTTLTLLMKVLLTFDEESDDLRNAITIPGGRRTEKKKPRLKTNVFIEKDAKFLEEAIDLDLKNNTVCEVNKRDNQFKKNICYFYNEIKEFSKTNDILDFIDFFMYDVSILPIQTEDNSPEKAREKALNIFETINNRGMSLSDSDIFKAKLYSMALNKLNHENFIERWKILDEECQNIEHSINDIFRFYTHIIRANNKITKSEIGLREFYTQKDYSPFKKKNTKYNEILDDLFKMIKIIKFFREIVRNPQKNQELTKWFQLIDLYSNQYPLNTLFVYLYVNGLEANENLIDFSKNLVKYIYYQGATTKIKFHLFEINSSFMNNEQKQINSPTNISLSDFDYFGQLKKGFALLSLYLNSKQQAIYPYYINRVINSRDVEKLNPSWKDAKYSEYVDTIGNMLIIDKDISRDVKLSRKIPSLKNSSIQEVKELATILNNWSYQEYLDRNNLLKERLKSFFEEKQ